MCKTLLGQPPNPEIIREPASKAIRLGMSALASSPSPASHVHYRPEIDGLRAIAILAVLLFHVGLGISGGYIGVDVFFVISGYLITSHILRDLERNTFSLFRFWERRARRILPALIVVVLATLALGWFVLLPGDYADLGQSAVWQSLFCANVYFWRDTAYFAGPAEEKPLLHMWSLAVEEQFYLVVPLLLLAIYRVPQLRNTAALLWLAGIGIIASVCLSVYGVSHHPSATFYLLPTRAWELLCGSIIAILPPAFAIRSAFRKEVLCTAGLACILIPCFLYDQDTPFPGLAAIPPCVGAAGVIFACSPAVGKEGERLPILGRLLALRPLVFVGLVSYSLYLWHWPIVAFSNYSSIAPLATTARIAIAVVSFGAAVLSWHFVETPFRNRSVCSSRLSLVSASFSGLAAVLLMGVSIYAYHGFPSRIPASAVRYAEAQEDNDGLHELQAEDVHKEELVRLGVGDSKEPPFLILWGDSHAMAVAPAFDLYLKERGLLGFQATASATAPVLDAFWQSEFAPNPVAFNNAVFDFIAEHKIPNVILVGYWEHYAQESGTKPLDVALVSTIKRVIDIGAQPYLMLQVPDAPFVPPKVLSVSEIWGYELTPYLAGPTNWNGVFGEGESFLEQLERIGCRIIDPRPRFWDSVKQKFIVELDGYCLYRDSHHLSAQGAKIMVAPVLRECLDLDNPSRAP